MKQKLYLLIICLMSCVTIWAQDDKPLWSIIDLKLTNVTDVDNKAVYKDDIYNLPIDAYGVKVKISFCLSQNQPTEKDKPKKIWYRLSSSETTDSFEPYYSPVENVDTLWSVSQEINLSMPTKGSDITISLGLSEDKLEYPADKLVRVWNLPGAPSLSPITYTTFTDKKFSFSVKEAESIPQGFLSKYYVNEKDVTETKEFEGNTKEDIGDKEKEDTCIILGYTYSFGGKVWVDKTGEKAIAKAATLTTYHCPVYKYSIKVNDQAPINKLDTTITHSDKVELIVEHYKYGYGDVFTTNWKGKEKYTAENDSNSVRDENTKVIMLNKISDDVVDSQEFPFTIHILPEIKVENTVANESYSFIPEGDTKIAVKKIHNQKNLKWDCKWKFGGVEINGTDSFDKNEITLSADQLKDTIEYTLDATVSCYYENNINKKYLDDETIKYRIHVVPNPKVTNYGDFNGQENIITCHDQQFKVKIETEGGYNGDDAFHFALESDGGKYGHSDKDKGTEYVITYENKGNDVVESDFSFGGQNIIPDSKSTTGVEQSRKVEGTSKTFHAKIYPYPEVQFKDQLDNYFYGSKISKSLENKNILPPVGNTWYFVWILDGETQSDFENLNEFSSTIKDGENNDSVKHTLVVKANNYYNKKLWASQELQLPFTAWHRAQLEGIELKYEKSNNNDIYEGHKFELSALQKYGYPKGWEYTWECDGSSGTLSTDSAHAFTAEFSGSEGRESQTYKLTVKNSIPGLEEEKDIFTGEKTLPITVWRKAENYTDGADASILTITDTGNDEIIDNRIREGRVLRLQVPKAQYGYHNDWTYSWNVSDENSNETTYTTSLQYSGESMSSEPNTIELSFYNMGPNGIAWEKTVISKPYTVYRKPRTPTSLAQKGNGASRTLIATMAITDDQLKDDEYYLCFGHRETNGAVSLIGEPQLQEGPGQTRFSMQVPQEQWNDMSNLCVFALWHYADGTWITSGLRFINDVKEDWDGSDYAGKNIYYGTTRGGYTTSIQEISSLSQDIQSTYNVSGAVRESLQRGLNVVRMTDGTVRKVIVK